MNSLPVISIESLVKDRSDQQNTAGQIAAACKQAGFFYIVDHGVSSELIGRLRALSRQFFALPLPEKREIGMQYGGRAWRGYFAVGDELTSGKPDQKEGIYFGEELHDDHPLVAKQVPLHGRNLFPNMDGFRETVLEYIQELTRVGHFVMRGIALSLDLDPSYFDQHLTRDPTILFRIFHYPALAAGANDQRWSVGEHTDYGILTILFQDETGGLQVRSGDKWIDATPIPNSFVCNLGDMLERMTAGRYRSTLHRVKNTSSESRLSFPFFFDPNWNAQIQPIFTEEAATPESERWDGVNLFDLHGTYGNYLLSKVAKVFPQLGKGNL